MRSAIIASGLLCLASRLAAQGVCADIDKLFAQPPVIGRWAELRMEKPSSDKKPTIMRMAVIGKESKAGKTLYRMQMVSADPRSGQPVIFQILAPLGLDALSSKEQSEVVMKVGDQPAMKMTKGRGIPAQDQSDLRKQCAKAKFVGEESVTVPAGTYKARHYSSPDGDSWVSAEVPAWHLVRTVDSDKSTMTLVAVGEGAKNEIRETPVDFKTLMNNPEAMKKLMGAGASGRDSSAR